MDAGSDEPLSSLGDGSRPALGAFRGLLRILLAVLGIWIFYLSLHPFVLVDSWSAYWDRLVEGLGTVLPGRPSLHLTAFALLGLLLGLSSSSGERVLGFPMVLLLPDFCLTIELLQAASYTRHPRLGDFVLNLAIAWLAHASTRRWFTRRPTRLPLLALRARILAALLLPVLLALFLLSPSYQAKVGSLQNWDADYPLFIGNELGGARPWIGRIRLAAVYSPALTVEEARSLSGNPDADIDERPSPWLYFDFSGGSMSERLRQRGRDSSLQRLVARGVRVEGKDLVLDGEAYLQSEAPPRPFVEQARRSGSFSLEVSLQTLALHQKGPARILSLSQGLYERDFTLGQVNDSLILRVRTPWNGENGHRFQGKWPGMMVPGQQRHLVVTYEKSQYRLCVDGRILLPHQDLSRGGLELTLLDLRSPVPALLLILLPLGMILSWLLRETLAETRRRREAGLGLLLTGIYLVAGYLAGSDPTGLTLVFLLTGIPLGDLMGTWLIGRPPDMPTDGIPAPPDEVT